MDKRTKNNLARIFAFTLISAILMFTWNQIAKTYGLPLVNYWNSLCASMIVVNIGALFKGLEIPD